MRSRLGLVVPWYGENIPGGAEAACRNLARALQAAGANVEVLTTCVREFASDWNDNFHAEGATVEGGIAVRRFRARRRDTAAFDEVNRKLASGATPSISDQEIYLRETVRSPALCDYLDRHRAGYVYLFLPYMFGTTYDGVGRCGERGVLSPCLHDEPQARMQLLRCVFERARGVVFLSEAERRLAASLFNLSAARTAVLGCPVECAWTGDAERFRARYDLADYLLYAGRTDAGKGFELLVEYFARYTGQSPGALKLAVAGGGPCAWPASLGARVVNLGYLDEQAKRDGLAGSLALAVPSAKESFSLVMMESWLAGRPVVANAACAVTTDFCRLSGGGLYFADYAEFREILDELAANGRLAGQLGRQGREYVLANYQPAQVAARYLETLGAWFD
jgi:glycosyltransferase involved in cell wall biosynthesis